MKVQGCPRPHTDTDLTKSPPLPSFSLLPQIPAASHQKASGPRIWGPFKWKTGRKEREGRCEEEKGRCWLDLEGFLLNSRASFWTCCCVRGRSKETWQLALDTGFHNSNRERDSFNITLGFGNTILEQDMISRLGQMGHWIYKGY